MERPEVFLRRENAVLESLFSKVLALQDCNFIKKRTRVFSCEYWEIFQNIYLKQHLRAAASGFLYLEIRTSTHEMNKIVSAVMGDVCICFHL